MQAPNLKNKGKELLGGPGKGKFLTNALTAVLILLLIITAYSVVQENKKDIPEVSLSELSSDILAGKVKEIIIADDKLNVTYADDTKKVGKKERESTLTDTLANYGVSGIALSGIKLSVENPKGFGNWLLQLAPFLIPVLFLIFFFWLLTRQVKGAGMQAFTFGQSKARVIYPDDKQERVTFKDVAGVKEAKEELVEIVDFLKNPKKFLDIGARIPKGVLLMGAPGTGKTLLARAVAGEARVPFFFISGSEFVEMFVGVGASRVRDLFQMAKKAAPSIIFVDEIDAVGRVRGAGVGGGNDEREQTLNQILVEMDGFEPHEKVIIIAASVTGDTPVLVRQGGDYKLAPISEIVDAFYTDNEEGIEKSSTDLYTLGFDKKQSRYNHKKNTYFGESAYKKVNGVLRHKVDEIYEITYQGGIIRATADHSIFINTQYGVKAKAVSELKQGDYLVALPHKANRTTKALSVVRAHVFPVEYDKQLQVYAPIYSPYAALDVEYESAISRVDISQAEMGTTIGYSQRTIGLWRNTARMPRSLSRAYFKHSLPETIAVTPELMRLFGYYAAEGYARKEVDFCFHKDEHEYIDDVKTLMRTIFGLEPDAERNHTTNATNIIYYSKPLAEFFSYYCGKGAHHKHIPPFLFEAPKQDFIEFFRGYFNGDGHKDKQGRLELTSVSRQLITELAWLARMHGFVGYVHSGTTPAGRRINGGKPLSATTYWRLGFGKTQNPLAPAKGKASTLRAKVKSIRRVPYNGYVYDFCGCDNEAFFGGTTPILLHNSNRPDVLDPALLRPGRFDRRVILDLPDINDREAILQIHGTKKPFMDDVKLRIIAERTPGFSGADLFSLMNEAAICAARANRKKVSQKDLFNSIEKVLLGPERRSHLLSVKEKKITAYHEAGHALVASLLPDADPVHKISIVSRGHAGGYTLKLPYEEKRLQTRKEFLDDIAVALGGYVAEKMIFDDLTTGPSSDLRTASALAHDMVAKYGMSDTFGPTVFEEPGGRLYYGQDGFAPREYSEDVSTKIDTEATKIVYEALARAENLIKENRKVLDAIADALVLRETLEHADFEAILEKEGIAPKKREVKEVA